MGRYLMYFQYIGTKYRFTLEHSIVEPLSGVVRANSPLKTEKRIVGVQDLLEKAFERFRAIDPVRLHVSSRTDAGVHALCNTAHFDLSLRSRRTGEPREIPTESIQASVNRYLRDEDIRITKILRVPDTFHSQYLAIGRAYVYRLAVGCRRLDLPVLERDRCWAIDKSLDTTSMTEGSRNFLGTHDFSAFRSNIPDGYRKSPFKTMDSIRFQETRGFLSHHWEGAEQLEFLEITFRSRSFLYRQIRRMTGALVAVGQGKIAPSDITTILQSRDNSHMHGTHMAPPHGLYLKEVLYNDSDLVVQDEGSPEEESRESSVT